MNTDDCPAARQVRDGGGNDPGADELYVGRERRKGSDVAPGPQGVAEQDLHELHIVRRFEEIQDRLDRGSDRMKALELELRANTATTNEVRELLELGRSGFKVLGWFGKAVKWVGGIFAAGGAIWSAIYMATHGGKPPGG